MTQGWEESKGGAGTRKLRFREHVSCPKSRAGCLPSTRERAPSREPGQWSQGLAGRDRVPLLQPGSLITL